MFWFGVLMLACGAVAIIGYPVVLIGRPLKRSKGRHRRAKSEPFPYPRGTGRGFTGVLNVMDEAKLPGWFSVVPTCRCGWCEASRAKTEAEG